MIAGQVSIMMLPQKGHGAIFGDSDRLAVWCLSKTASARASLIFIDERDHEHFTQMPQMQF